MRDLSLADDLAHDALVAVLEQWPVSGVPDRPGTWLMTLASADLYCRVRNSNA